MRDMISRFWSKVNKGPGCWEWTACTNGVGYGLLYVNNKKRSAHRISYEIEYGPIPIGKYVCHHCDNRKCIRPSHLFLGTQQDNIQDAIKKGKTAKGERNGSSKLTKEQVISIRNDDRKFKEIADEYGITHGYVGILKRKETWKHI